MINEVIKLVEPKKLEICFLENDISSDEIVVKPEYLSICAADQRYYQGKRKKEILDKKLPLCLIHEAVGSVLYDPKNQYKVSEKVVLIPNTPTEENSIIKENYLKTSKFRSSSSNGFMQNIVLMKRDRVIPIREIDEKCAVILELVSVVVNAIENFQKMSHKKKDILGVWGDGALGYLTSLLLKIYFPNSQIVVFGKHAEKLNYFSFIKEKVMINSIREDLYIDHAFECVGGKGSESAIDQIIDIINPQGSISLLGVTEEPININTRMVLEKGITLLGNSRSGYEDFEKAVELLQDKQIQDYVDNIISEVIDVNSISDIYKAFDVDAQNDFKTIMRWNI